VELGRSPARERDQEGWGGEVGGRATESAAGRYREGERRGGRGLKVKGIQGNDEEGGGERPEGSVEAGFRIRAVPASLTIRESNSGKG